MDDNTQKVIEALAAKLGTTAEKLWAVQVSWERTGGIVGAIGAATAIMVGIALIFVAAYCFREAAKKTFSDWGFGGAFAMLGAVSSIAFGMISGFVALAALLNPEGAALQSILHALR